jgi:ABC-type amino acid transport substrate-binding protein
MKIFDFSAPIYDDSINVVVLKGKEFPFNSLADLEGKIIGVQSGASYGSEVDAAIQSGKLTVEADQGHISRLNKLLHGRIEAAFIGNGQRGLQALLESDTRLAANKDQFVVLPRQLAHDLLYLGFAKTMNKQVLLENFNRWLIEAQENQTIDQLVRMQAEEPTN